MFLQSIERVYKVKIIIIVTIDVKYLTEKKRIFYLFVVFLIFLVKMYLSVNQILFFMTPGDLV